MRLPFRWIQLLIVPAYLVGQAAVTAEPPFKPQAGDVRIVNLHDDRLNEEVPLALVYIPAGTFQMGSTNPRHSDERPVHLVTLTHGFWIGKFPVTQRQWWTLMRTNPSKFKNVGPEAPVERIGWWDAQNFIHQLNDLHLGTFRLPTEAEWEYACRAGTTGERYGDLEAIAWYNRNSGGSTHPVGQKQPNAWGLYDMIGNVWQWCQDCIGHCVYEAGPAIDPTGAPGGGRIFRGGGWDNADWCCRSTCRMAMGPAWGSTDATLGFRVVLEASPASP